MALQRTQKGLAKRIDQAYFQKSHPWRRARKILVFLCSAPAILYLALSFGAMATSPLHQEGLFESVHNPGHLIPAHASFENDCAKCHGGAGRFSLEVTDSACLQCHDAAAHSQNQAMQVKLVTVNGVQRATRAANCVDCHVEHRGTTIMTGGYDQYCTQCHANLGQGLGKLLDPTKQVCPASVTAFTKDGHPKFGRELMQNGKMFDPTVLRFDHQEHWNGPLKGEEKNCTWCHTPGSGVTEERGAPPGTLSLAPTAMPVGTAVFRSLHQVSYEKNCKVCHNVGDAFGNTAASDVPVPHADMAAVRLAILNYVADPTAPWEDIEKKSPDKGINAALEESMSSDGGLTGHEKQFNADLAAITAAVNASPIMVRADAPPGKMDPIIYAKIIAALDKAYAPTKANVGRRRPYLTPLAATTKPSPQYKMSAQVLRSLRRFVNSNSPDADQDELLAALARFDRGAPDPRLIEFYVAEGNGGMSCVLCHDVKGDPSAVPSDWSFLRAASAAPAAPATQPTDFAIVPTGIPDGPRHWFVNSEFNHDAHRSMNCVECHAAALTSSLTSDVLSPDIEWQGYNHEGTAVVARSCVECHHAEDSTGLGARANCTECHVYHDRNREEPVAKGTPPPWPTTRPAVADAAP